MTALKRYAGLIVPFGLAAVTLGGYWAYWSRAAEAIEVGARKALPKADSVDVVGFPFRMTILAKGLEARAPSGLTFAASQLEATASPFNPTLWVLVGALEPKLGLPGGPVRPLKAADLKASLRFNGPTPSRFSLTFAGLEAQGEGGWTTGAGAFHLVADPKDTSRMALSADLSDLTLGRAPDGPAAILGQKIKHTRLAGPITQAPALFKSAKDWAASGGTIQVMAGDVHWGPVSLTKATGELGLNPAGQWNGTLKGEGALKPEGIKLDGLTAPVELNVRDGQISVLGLPGIRLPSGFN